MSRHAVRATVEVVALTLPALGPRVHAQDEPSTQELADLRATTEVGKFRIELYHPPAEQGNTEAQIVLGWMYYNGEGVPQDFAEAAAWYRKAAKQGDAGAQTTLWEMYLHGEGVPQDDVEAVAWHRKAAEHPPVLAMPTRSPTRPRPSPTPACRIRRRRTGTTLKPGSGARVVRERAADDE